MDTSRLLASYNYHTPTHQLPVAVDRQTDRQTDRTFILINHSSFAIKMSQPNINTPNSDLVSSLSQSQSYLSPNFLVILPGLTSSVRLCGVERCPAQQSEEEEENTCKSNHRTVTRDTSTEKTGTRVCHRSESHWPRGPASNELLWPELARRPKKCMRASGHIANVEPCPGLGLNSRPPAHRSFKHGQGVLRGIL